MELQFKIIITSCTPPKIYLILVVLFISFKTELKAQYVENEGTKWCNKMISNSDSDNWNIKDSCNFIIDVGEDISIDIGDDFELEVIANIALSDIESVSWTPSGTLSCNDCFDPIASPSENTCYIVMVTDLLNCTQSDTVCVFVQTTAVEDLAETETIDLFPNPTHDKITITSDKHILSEIKIYDIHGRLVMIIPNQNLTLQNIHVSELKTGIYFLEVSIGNHFSRKKFVKR